MKITFEIKNKEYKIRDILLKEYYEIKNDLLLDATDAKFNIIHKLSGCPIEDLRNLNLENWSKIWEALENLIDYTKDKKLVKTFTHDEIEYGLVEIDYMTIGEFSDLDVILNSTEVDNKLHELLAILYRPIKSTNKYGYEIEDYDYKGFKLRSKIFLDIPLFLAKPATTFFLHTGITYLKSILSSLMDQKNLNPKIQEIIGMIKSLLETGGLPLTHLPEEILLISKELQNLESEKHLITLFGDTNRIKKRKNKKEALLKNIKIEYDNLS